MGGKTRGSVPKVRTGPAMKFRPPVETGRFSAVGTKPLAEAASVANVLAMMVVHVARKILYGVDVSHKVGMYVVGTLVLSVLGDFTSHSTHYMAQQGNVFNTYFVKFGWGWTLLFTGAFVFTTSYTYGCGSVRVIKNQMMRLIIATGVWYGLTGAFLLIEERSGVCNVTRLLNKDECMKGGFAWRGFDISGHCFLLVWNSLFMIEEAKAYLGWEKIKDMLRNEEHRRLSTDINAVKDASNVLSKLSLDEFLHLRKNYNLYTPHVRVFFCLMSVLVLLWDVMLVCTALYFHIMIEKVIACLAAVVLWFVLYRGIYVHPWSPGLPGEGPFKYVCLRVRQESLQRKESLKKSHENRWQPKDEVPKFMGMPLTALSIKTDASKTARGEEESSSNVAESRQSVDAMAVQKPLRRARSRSSSRSSSKFSLNSKYL